MGASEMERFRLINWNIGGAKFLELRKRKDIAKNPDPKRGGENEESRESFREKLA